MNKYNGSTQRKIGELIRILSTGDEKFGGDIAEREYAWHVDSYDSPLFPYTGEEERMRSSWDNAARSLVDMGEPAIRSLTRLEAD